MSYLMDSLHNSANKLRKAAEFHEFTWKMLQIHAAERWAEIIAPTRWYKAPRLPTDLVIRVTEKCFLGCKFCAQGGERGRVDRSKIKDDFIKRETLGKIIDEASRWPIKPFIKITGGEPLMMGSDLFDAIREMRERRFAVMLSTNGMLLQDKKIARAIVETDLNCLAVSLDGSRKAHNKLRGNPKLFDAVMEGIDNVQRYREELGKKNPMIPISMVVSSETQYEIENAYRIASEKKADWFRVQHLNYTTPETCEQARLYAHGRFGMQESRWTAFCNPRFRDVDQDSVARQIDAIGAMRESVPIYILGGLSSSGQIARYYHTLEPIRRHICGLPFTSMHIVMPGKAVFCIDFPFYEYGDVREDGLESVWLGKAAEDFRGDLLGHYAKHQKNYPQCQRCSWMFTTAP